MKSYFSPSEKNCHSVSAVDQDLQMYSSPGLAPLKPAGPFQMKVLGPRVSDVGVPGWSVVHLSSKHSSSGDSCV